MVLRFRVPAGLAVAFLVVGAFWRAWSSRDRPRTRRSSPPTTRPIGHTPTAPTIWRLGGAGGAGLSVVAAAPGGDVFVGGAFSGRWTGGSFRLDHVGGRDAWVARLDAAGKARWTWRLGGKGDEWASAIAPGRGGDVVVAASLWRSKVLLRAGTVTSARELGCVLARLDGRSGKVRWVRPVEGTGSTKCRSVRWVRGGRLLVAGFNSGVLRLGAVRSAPAGKTDVFVAEVSAKDGRILHCWGSGGPGGDIARGRSLWVVGQFSGVLSAGGRTVRSLGGSDGYVARWRGLR